MQTLTESILKLNPPCSVFDETVIATLFPGRTKGAKALLVHRAVDKGEIIRLTPGIFLLAPEYRRKEPHPFVVASILHFPSQVSLTSALSFHGLIPEAVHQTSCVTPRRSRSFDTPIGVYEFIRIPMKDTRAGVKAISLGNGLWASMSVPLRAIADMVYLDRSVTWAKDGLGYLTESLRIEEEDLSTLDFASADEILDGVKSKRTRIYIERMRRELMAC